MIHFLLNYISLLVPNRENNSLNQINGKYTGDQVGYFNLQKLQIPS